MTEIKNKIVLVADDEPDVAKVLQIAFDKEGYRVIVVANGKEAMDEIQKEKPAIVISDILMPFINGLKLCENIKTNPKTSDVPVILLTAVYRQDHHVDIGFETGADAYFSKPFKIERLVEVAKKMMGDIPSET